MCAQYSYNHPPSPQGIPSSGHRQRPVQPPHLLTASLGVGNMAQAPHSTNSLSSPFAYPQSAYPASPGGALRGTSPMQFRTATSFPTAYNPQQWGPVSNTSPHSSTTIAGHVHLPQPSRVTALAPRLVGPDEPVASPPPPYSPRRDAHGQHSPQHAIDTLSPSDTTSPDTDASHNHTPISSATTVSPDFFSRQLGARNSSSRPVSSITSSPSLISQPTFAPPPPTQGSSSRVRSLSKNHADKIFSSLTSRHKSSNTPSPVSAINALHETTSHVLTQGPDMTVDPNVRPPASRRAVSTGGIGIAGVSPHASSQLCSPIALETGVSLPPPPPGPPPASGRSQSLNRHVESPSSTLAPTFPSRTRRPPGSGTTLETVPPTPADWREGDSMRFESPHPRSKGPSPLHIDTGSIVRRKRSGLEDVTTAVTATTRSRRDSSTGGLFRSPAVRNRSAKGIRERRSESRNGKERVVEDSAAEPSSNVEPWHEESTSVRPTDLVLPRAALGSMNQRPKATPRSGKSMQSIDGALNSAGKSLSSGKAVSFEHSITSRLPESALSQHPSPRPIYTPPLPLRSEGHGEMQTTSSTPTILSPHSDSGLHPRRSIGRPKALSLIVPLTSDERPVSHLLHLPNPDDPMQVPLTPSTLALQRPVSDLLGPESPRAFAGRAIERHRRFAEREATATNDSERLDLFVQFMIAESRIRRDQYAKVFEDENIEADDLMRGFFGETPSRTTFEEVQRNLSGVSTSKRTSIGSSAQADSSSQEESSSFSRVHESPSSITTSSSAQRPESAWMKDYIPSLSPIASMSIVTGQDDSDSRGRAPTRWWEDHSRSGDGTDDAFNVLGRSKRESKYMGVPKEARDSTIFQYPASGSSSKPQAHSSGNSQHFYGSDEYPPEKVGWHEDNHHVIPLAQPATPASAPYTPDSRGLDVSRLITLPPPYPRHHPAVNNSHPDLADSRAVIRSLSEKEQVNTIREAYQSEVQVKRQRADSWCNHQRSLHQQDVQFRMEHGEMTQEQYEDAEGELEAKIDQSEKEIAQVDFDLFQNMVVSPLHALFAERITVATSSLARLSSRLFSDAQSHSPNLPQEEGDEQPELLEKLTQLKWLFEGRETLHRQTYDLLSERNDKYRTIVLLPYKQSQNNEKQADAESFFAQDAADRKLAWERAVSDRAHTFLSVIDHNVSRGVEVQLGCFWDIAPQLLDLLHKIPRDLDEFEVRIPAEEYKENPSYYDHSLQYLSSLLGHAEKSTYQFIESQVNLLCLLHEIRSCALAAKCRVDATERSEANVDGFRVREEKRLTEDLKEKVGVIEGQWEEALGAELMEVRERVRGRLLEEGGWDDEGVDV